MKIVLLLLLVLISFVLKVCICHQHIYPKRHHGEEKVASIDEIEDNIKTDIGKINSINDKENIKNDLNGKKINHDDKYSHKHDHKHDHTHDHTHDHNHDCEHHKHHGHHDKKNHKHHHHNKHKINEQSEDKNNNEILNHHSHKNMLNDMFETYLLNYIESLKNTQRAYVGVLIVSLIPIPIFVFMILFKFSSKSIISLLSALGAGSLLGDIISHNLPELMSKSEHNHHSHHHHIHSDHNKHSNFNFHEIKNILVSYELVLCYGIVFALLFENIFSSNCSDHNHNDLSDDANIKQVNNQIDKDTEFKLKVKERRGIFSLLFLDCFINASKEVKLSFLNDFLHNFTDGVSIGASFKISTKLGISNVLAISSHEIPHEIADFSYLLKKDVHWITCLSNQLLASLGSFLGVYFCKKF